MKKLIIPFLALLLVIGTESCCRKPENSSKQDAEYLFINPIAQQTEVWCWAAVAEMTFRNFKLPNVNPAGNYQCGIVAYHGGRSSLCWNDCSQCVAPIGGMTEMQKVINEYGITCNVEGFKTDSTLCSQIIFRPLTFQELKTEIKAHRPVISGISFAKPPIPNFSEHVVLIVGYSVENGYNLVMVNDPFPYAYYNQISPYQLLGGTQEKPGQYIIEYNTFIANLKWANTIYNIHTCN